MAAICYSGPIPNLDRVFKTIRDS